MFRVKPSLFLVLVLLATWIGQGQALAFDVDAKSALLLDASTGQILYEKNADERLPPASLTKIMTVLVVMDAVKAGSVSLEDPVRTSRRAWATGGSQVWLAEGETHSLERMLRAISIASANDASVAVAEFMAGTVEAFTLLMNERAVQLGMLNSYFGNAEGLPPGPGEIASYTTARDIAKAAQTLIYEHPEVLQWTSTAMEQFRASPLFILYNTNRLVGSYDGLDGLKTGFTNAAGYCLVATAQRGDVRLISVVMGTESQAAREERTRTLLDHGFLRFVPLLVSDENVGQISVPTGKPERINVRIAQPARVLQPRGQVVDVQTEIRPAEGLQAPISAGTPVGEYVVRLDGFEVYRVPVLAGEDVTRANAVARVWRSTRDLIRGILP